MGWARLRMGKVEKEQASRAAPQARTCAQSSESSGEERVHVADTNGARLKREWRPPCLPTLCGCDYTDSRDSSNSRRSLHTRS